jgi:hypothetical protein
VKVLKVGEFSVLPQIICDLLAHTLVIQKQNPRNLAVAHAAVT